MDNENMISNWRKASHRFSNGGCVEAGPVLKLTPDTWARLTRDVKNGRAVSG